MIKKKARYRNDGHKCFLLVVVITQESVAKIQTIFFFKKNEGNQCNFDLFHFPERRVRNSICFSKVNVQLGYRKFRQSESGKFFVFSKYR